MIITNETVAERYILAVEAETRRTRLYEELLAAQLAGDHIAAAAAQAAIGDLEGEGDY